MLIGLCGPEGAGKTTAAKIIARDYGAALVPFARPLKVMLSALGIPERHLYGTPEDKAEALEMLCGKSARHAMRTLGTEWGRECIGAGFWGDLWEQRVIPLGFVVADDCRFPNEAERVKRLGGHVIRIVRSEADLVAPPADAKKKHPSAEHLAVKADAVVLNYSTPKGLRYRLQEVITGLGYALPASTTPAL